VDAPTPGGHYRRWLKQAGQRSGSTLGDLSGCQLADSRPSVTSSTLAPASQLQAIAALRRFLT
jgi:hypothetical protein